jgi:hypothetical protein
MMAEPDKATLNEGLEEEVVAARKSIMKLGLVRGKVSLVRHRGWKSIIVHWRPAIWGARARAIPEGFNCEPISSLRILACAGEFESWT